MKKTSLLCGLLAALLLVPAFASCGEAPAAPSSPSGTAATSEDIVTEAVDPNLPAVKGNYNGASFRVIYPTHANFRYQHSDESTGDVLETALYERDSTLEDLLNIDFRYTVTEKIEEVYDKVSASILAGDDTFDLILNHVNWSLTNYIAERLVLDWYSIPNVDLTRPYWNQNMNSSLAIDNVLPIAASDYIIAGPLMLLFNTDLVEGFGLDNPYDAVADGSWTWDKLIGQGDAVLADINGDSVMDASDRYGFAVDISGSSYLLRSIPASCNQYSYSKASDGALQLTVNTQQMQGILEKCVGIFNGGCGLLYKNPTGKQSTPEQVAFFGTGNVLYYLVDSLYGSAYRGIEFEYGILPLPKYDEKQDGYHSLNWSGLMLVPVTAPDTDMVGCVAEWLAYQSNKDVLPVFFETLMDEKVARDDTSSEMLSLIFSTLVYDPAINYKSPGFYTFFDSLIMSKKTDLASYYSGKESADLAYIQTLNDNFAAFKSN